jgi:hypothetical protein
MRAGQDMYFTLPPLRLQTTVVSVDNTAAPLT